MTDIAATPSRRGILLVAAAAVTWGTIGPVAAVLYPLSGLGAAAMSFWRFVFAALALAVLRVFRPASANPVSWRTIIASGAGLATFQLAYFAAITYTGVAVATVVTLGIAPVMVAVAARVFLAERLSVGVGVAIGCGVVGLGLLAVHPSGAGSGWLLGVGLALLSAAGYSVTILLGRTMRGGPDTTLHSCAVALVCVAPFALLDGLVPRDPLPSFGWLIYLGLVPTALGYWMFFAGLATNPASLVAIVVLLEPAVATVLAVCFLGETLDIFAAVGTALLLATAVLPAILAVQRK